MGFLDFFKRPDIDAGIEQYKKTAGAVLLDVRTKEEYSQGHVPGSRNLDVKDIDSIAGLVPDKSTPLFVFCYSGARSAHAVSQLKAMGYTGTVNIGGIAGYHGKIER